MSHVEDGRALLTEDFVRMLQREAMNPRTSNSRASALGDEAFEVSMAVKEALSRILSDPAFASAHPHIVNNIVPRPFNRAAQEQRKWIERQGSLFMSLYHL